MIRKRDLREHRLLEGPFLGFIRFYNLFWGAKVTVQMRVLSAPTFFSIKNRHMHSNPLQLK